MPDADEPAAAAGDVGDMLGHYSAALDQIYRHRVAAAYEARVIAGVLELASLPLIARARLEGIRDRLLLTARGGDGHAEVDSKRRQLVLAAAGAPLTLTRGEWERRCRR